MNKKSNTSLWIIGIVSPVLITALMSGCFLKGNNSSGIKYHSQGENSSNLTDQDLSKFASSLRKVDGEAVAHYKMALYFQKQKKHRLAIEELKKAVGRDSSYAKAYNAMGISYDMLGKYGRAIDCYQLALTIDPDFDDVHNNLGYSYLLSDNLDAAIASFQKAIQLNGQNKRYRNNLALVYVMKERYDLAIDQLKDLEGGPHAGETVAKLAYELNKKDFEEQIVSVLQKMKLEKDSNRLAKPDPGESAILQQKMKKQDTESDGRQHFVISGKIETAANEENNSELSENKDPSGRNHILQAWEGMITEVGELTENNQVISVISKVDSNPADGVPEKPVETAKNDKQLVGDDQKFSNQSFFLAATELYSQPATEKPASIEKEFQKGNRTPPSRIIARENTERPQTKIKPGVVNVNEVFKHAGKYPGDTLLSGSNQKLFVVGRGEGSNATRKISPVYVASASPSKRKDSGSLYVVEILPSYKDEKIELAAGPEEIRTEKTDDYLVELEITNGSGEKGMAGRIRDLLKINGFKIIKTTNANYSDHISTKIFYSNRYRRTVGRIVQKIGCCSEERNIIELENLGKRIKILVGKDLAQP